MRRIVLDTNVVRNLAYESGCRIDIEAAVAHRHEIQFSIASAAVREVLTQLLNSGFTFKDWQKAARTLDRFISQDLPVFPRLINFNDIMNFVTDNLIESVEVINASKYVWRVVKGIEDPNWPNQVDRNSFINGIIEPPRNEYIQFIDNFINIGEIHNESQDQIIKRTLDFFSHQYGGSNTAGIMEVPARSLGRFIYLQRQEKNPLNPKAKKRRGDPYDFEILHVTAIPETQLCTADKKLIIHLKDAGVEIPGRVISVDNLNESLP